MQKSFIERINIWLPLLLALVLVIGLVVGMRLQSAGPSIMVQQEEREMGATILGEGRVQEILRYIEAKYVDATDQEALTREAIQVILQQLDPHSTFIPKEELQEVNEQLQGNFDGIGIEFMILDDTVVVVAPLGGGPSEEVGVRAGDKIIMIGDSIVAGRGLDNSDIVERLRGEKGTRANISVQRNGEPRLLEFSIMRDEIPMNSLDVAYMIDDKTGYVKINRFSATTTDEFVQVLERLVEKANMRDLIIDLRHNPGGYLQQATNLLSQLFTERGKLLVYTKGRSVSRTDYSSTGRAYYRINNVVVLIDEGSASASEIVAGAVQDHDRGIIIGRRSFGKGLVQEQYPLRDGSALRLTVARYYTPSGRSIQKPYDDPQDYDMETLHRLENGELANGGAATSDSTQLYYTNNGHPVYGGGGITPDLFVPLDTLLLGESYNQLRQLVPSFIFRFVEERGARYRDWSTERFVQQFRVDEAMYRSFIDYARTQQPDLNINNTGRLRREVQRYLQARLAKQLYGDEAFYRVWNEQDAVVRKAREVLAKPDPLATARTLSLEQ